MGEAEKISPVELNSLIHWPAPENITEEQIQKAREIAGPIVDAMGKAAQTGEIIEPMHLSFVIDLDLGEANPIFNIYEVIEMPPRRMRLPRLLQEAVEISREMDAARKSPGSGQS